VLCEVAATARGLASLAALEALHSIVLHFPAASERLLSEGADDSAGLALQLENDALVAHAASRLILRLDSSRNMRDDRSSGRMYT
jgi:hypothetical protein